METAIEPVETLTVKETARLISKSEEFVRAGLILGRLPFGSAVKQEGALKWDFNIIKSKVLEYANIRRLEDMNLGDVSTLRTKQYVAYKIPANVLKKELLQDCICSSCNKECSKIWLVANNEQLYCDHCLTELEENLKGFVCDWDMIKHNVAKYNKIFKL